MSFIEDLDCVTNVEKTVAIIPVEKICKEEDDDFKIKIKGIEFNRIYKSPHLQKGKCAEQVAVFIDGYKCHKFDQKYIDTCRQIANIFNYSVDEDDVNFYLSSGWGDREMNVLLVEICGLYFVIAPIIDDEEYEKNTFSNVEDIITLNGKKYKLMESEE